MKAQKLKRLFFISTAIILGSFICAGFIEPLSVSKYEYHNNSVPKSFDGFKIVQLSDFHCKDFGEDEHTLIDKIKDLSPDLILFTGDMVDEIHSTDNLDKLLKGIYNIAPIYAITGNHDTIDNSIYEEMLSLYNKYDVQLLDDSFSTVTSDNDTINIYGSGFSDWAGNCIQATNDNSKNLNILLYHDSNAFPLVSNMGYDIIFAGHTHGGIIRLPFIGGLIGNDKKLFPKYSSGSFYNANTSCTMYVSRGLGDSDIPRFYNSPELILVTLYSD